MMTSSNSANVRVVVVDAQSVTGLRKLGSEVMAYQELLFVFAGRDIKIRYKQTLLGAAWAVLQPLLTMIIFSIVFGRLAKIPSENFPYPVYVFAGLVPWMLFANCVSAASNSLVGTNHLISKVYFPRILVPVGSVGVFGIDAAIATAVLVILMLFFGVSPSLTIVFVPLLIMAVMLSALGVGVFLSAFTVRYRDFRFVTPFLVQIWMYVTPVVYPLNLVSEQWRWLFGLNPVAGLIEAFRWACLGKPVDPLVVLMSVAVSAALFLGAVVYFQKVERSFADVI